ncbi:MAG TPA: lipopolysaccharide biosynthesis protein [Caulobacterales bacterium]|nr:lipopolysaccharide biosynthesis protein [Caulobacterales bacterium]
MDIEEAKRRARAGPRLLLARRAVLLAITFISTITVARLVSPRDYGLSAISAAVLSFVQIFRDFGLTNAVLRKAVIDQSELTMIFWFNVAMTTGLSLLLVLMAPAVGSFYGEAIIGWTMLASIVGFQVGGLALQHRALINRELRFGVIAVIDVASQAAGFAVTLTLAFIRHDVWALVIGSVVQNLCAATLAISLGRWRPGLPRRTEGFADLLRFGANSSVYSISVFLSNSAAQLIAGYALGSALLGQYNRAQAIFQLPNTNLVQPIAQSIAPLLTRLRADPVEYRTAYLGLVRRLCVFLMPLSIVLMGVATPLTRTLLGDRWETAGHILAALAPAFAAMGVGYAVDDVFITQNRSRGLRNLGLVELALRVTAIVIGAQFGIVETAIGFTASTIVVIALRVWVTGRHGPITARDQLMAGLPGVAPALGALLAVAAALEFAAGLPDALQVLLIGGCGVFAAIAAGLATRASREALADLADMFGLGRYIAIASHRRSA